MDGANIVFNRQEGSGEAQILGKATDPLGVLAAYKANADKERAAKLKRDAEAAKRLTEKLTFDGVPWELHTDEINELRESRITEITELLNQGQSLDDPTSKASKLLRNAKTEIEALTNQSEAIRKKFNDARVKVTESPGLYDLEQFDKAYEEVASKSIKELRGSPLSFLVENYDFFKPLEAIEIKKDDYKEDIDGDGFVTKKVDVDKLEENIARWAITDQGQYHYQSGLKRDMWKTPEEHQEWVMKKRLGDKDASELTQVFESPESRGLQFSFGAGGGSAAIGKWNVGFSTKGQDVYVDQVSGKKIPIPITSNDKPLRMSFSYSDKQAPAMAYSLPNGEKVNGKLLTIEEIPGQPGDFKVYIRKELEKGIRSDERYDADDIAAMEAEMPVYEVYYSQNEDVIKSQVKNKKGESFDPFVARDKYYESQGKSVPKSETSDDKGKAVNEGNEDQGQVDVELQQLPNVQSAVIEGDSVKVKYTKKDGSVATKTISSNSKLLQKIKSGEVEPDLIDKIRNL